jgi:hypothetical protein
MQWSPRLKRSYGLSVFFTFLCPPVSLTGLIDYFCSEVRLILCCTIGLFNQVCCVAVSMLCTVKMSVSKQKRNVVKVEKKLNASESIDKGEYVAKICSELNLGKNTIGVTIQIIVKIILKDT